MIYKSKDNSESALLASISASSTQLEVPTGSGALFPSSFSIETTSLGDKNTLNRTGIQSSLSGIVAVGDWINNITDGSSAVIKQITTTSVITTDLKGGTSNVWGNGDTIGVNTFIATISKRDADNNITEYEKVRIRKINGDTMLFDLSDRGFSGTTPSAFSAGDIVSLFVEEDNQNKIKEKIGTNTETLDDLFYNDIVIDGDKSFSSFPITPSSAPTANYQVANKKYIDDKYTALKTGTVNFTGKKRFYTVPESKQDPTGADDLVRKSYFDKNSYNATQGVSEELRGYPSGLTRTTRELMFLGGVSHDTSIATTDVVNCSPNIGGSSYRSIFLKLISDGTSFSDVSFFLIPSNNFHGTVHINIYSDNGSGTAADISSSPLRTGSISASAMTASSYSLHNITISPLTIPDKTVFWVVFSQTGDDDSTYLGGLPGCWFGQGHYSEPASGHIGTKYNLIKNLPIIKCGNNNSYPYYWDIPLIAQHSYLHNAGYVYGIPNQQNINVGDNLDVVVSGFLDVTGDSFADGYHEYYKTGTTTSFTHLVFDNKARIKNRI